VACMPARPSRRRDTRRRLRQRDLKQVRWEHCPSQSTRTVHVRTQVFIRAGKSQRCKLFKARRYMHCSVQHCACTEISATYTKHFYASRLKWPESYIYMYIYCVHKVFLAGKSPYIHTVIYGVCRVGHNHIYTVHIRYF
jgi:hypothetical protein